MTYYKALLKEPYMTSKYGYKKYELGVTERIADGTKLQMCENGFHYTDNVFSILNWYEKNTYDVFEVVPGGEILHNVRERKYCSSELTIIRQLSEDELRKLYRTTGEELLRGDYYDRRNLVILTLNDKFLDILVNDMDYDIRCVVAERGRDKDLDILVNDEDYSVRCAVAKHGRDKDLDVLVNDEDWHVKCAVAEHRRDKDLDILVNDEDRRVRCAVAKYRRDKDLDILVNDEDWRVRLVVAEYGRDKDLDVLVNDRDCAVKDMALKLRNSHK